MTWRDYCHQKGVVQPERHIKLKNMLVQVGLRVLAVVGISIKQSVSGSGGKQGSGCILVVLKRPAVTVSSGDSCGVLRQLGFQQLMMTCQVGFRVLGFWTSGLGRSV
jgi:hypothetical protein